MKGLTRQRLTCLVLMSVLELCVWAKQSEPANSTCTSSGKVLTATTTPATENFTWSNQTSLDEGDSCKWIIRYLLADGQVKLAPVIFNLINLTTGNKGDCINIYDADEIDNKHHVDTVCGVTRQMYTSKNSAMLVVFTRGDSEGKGSFTMKYSSASGALPLTSLPIQETSPQPLISSSSTNRTLLLSSSGYKLTPLPTKPYKPSSPSQQMSVSLQSGTTFSPHPQTLSEESLSAKNTERTVRIVGIIAAALAGMGLTFVVLKVTKCCRCLRKKDNSGASHAGSSLGERVRLAQAGQQDRVNGSDVHANSRADMSQPLSIELNNDAVPSASHTRATTVEEIHESDSDSQQDLNEPPPSYESLYLNELGEAVTPPKYSPPVHRSSHPPRRVHTFN